MQPKNREVLGAIVFGGIVAATIDIGAATLISGSGPAFIMHAIAGGLIYGVVIFFVMNYVVVPLSAWKSMPHFTALKFAENMAAMLLFGLIVAFFARRLASAPLAQHEAAAPA